ncbi:lipopolysaccharide biosynthesis protein WzxC [Photobacterium aphoticum]|uniref:Lipopolysaccharide biosynthesis protein WzxC n=1 Tax=Photobacterium aphoticum TaxID=754436 RepID=A0A090QTS6_9GAMM|nr:lipopolysaccharide biosynthesis protein WzxC [Photobacterium aphoticum]
MAISDQEGLMHSAKWALICNWYGRAIGLVNTIVLLKLLEPADFGIAALATFFVSLFAAFSHMGTNKFVITQDNMSKAELDSLWTLGLVIKCVSAVILFVSADWIAAYVNNAAMGDVIRATSVIPILLGLRNVALGVEEKNYNFKLLIVNTMLAKTVGTVVSISLAIYLETYWALIIGVITLNVTEIALGYIMCPYWPKLSCRYWHKQWNFSKWLYLSSVFGYLRSRIDVLILGSIVDTRSVGMYNVSTEFAWLSFVEVVTPINRGLFAVLAKLRETPLLFQYRLLKQMSLNMLIVIPCAFGMMAIAGPFTAIVLGDEWLEAEPLIVSIAGLMVVMSSHGLLNTALTVQKKLGVLLLSDIIAIGVIATVFMTHTQSTVLELAQLRMMIGIGFLCWLWCLYYTVLKVALSDLLWVYALPLFSSVVMYLGVTSLIGTFQHSLVQLIVGVLAGIVLYISLFSLLAYLLRNRFVYFWECCDFTYDAIQKRVQLRWQKEH